MSDDSEVDNILATTLEVDDDMAIPDTAVVDYELPSTTEATTPHTHTHTHTQTLSMPSTWACPISCLPTSPSRREPRLNSQILLKCYSNLCARHVPDSGLHRLTISNCMMPLWRRRSRRWLCIQHFWLLLLSSCHSTTTQLASLTHD